MIYVRQSSPNQVLNNQESQRLQYALRERAIQLGWHEQDVEIIDAGSRADGRDDRGTRWLSGTGRSSRAW